MKIPVLAMLAAITLPALAAEQPVKTSEPKQDEESIVTHDNWVSMVRKNLGDELLSPLAQKSSVETYRLTVCGAFGAEVSIRLTRTDDHYDLTRRSGSWRDDSSKAPEVTESRISLQQAEEFQKLFVKTSFFTASTNENCRGFDGADYLLEVVKDGKYHAVVRWSPASETGKRDLAPFISCCDWLIQHAPKIAKQKAKPSASSPSRQLSEAAKELR